MLKVICLPVGELKANCFLVFDSLTRECLILDPGDDAELIKDKIVTENLIPKYLFATHGHFDHTLASLELKLIYSLPFKVNSKDRFLIDRAKESGNYFSSFKNNFKVVCDESIEKNDKIKLGKESLEVLETPGHTPGSISLYSPQNKILFVGDLIFADGSVGRIDHKYSSKKDLIFSIKRLLKLPNDVIVYCGHGTSFFLQEFKQK